MSTLELLGKIGHGCLSVGSATAKGYQAYEAYCDPKIQSKRERTIRVISSLLSAGSTLSAAGCDIGDQSNKICVTTYSLATTINLLDYTHKNYKNGIKKTALYALIRVGSCVSFSIKKNVIPIDNGVAYAMDGVTSTLDMTVALKSYWMRKEVMTERIFKIAHQKNSWWPVCHITGRPIEQHVIVISKDIKVEESVIRKWIQNERKPKWWPLNKEFSKESLEEFKTSECTKMVKEMMNSALEDCHRELGNYHKNSRTFSGDLQKHRVSEDYFSSLETSSLLEN